MMSSKAHIEQVFTNLKTEEKTLRNQIVYLNGQITYNLKMQEIFDQLLRDLHALEETSNKSKASKKVKK